MVKMYFLCCSNRTRIKDHGMFKLRIAGLDKVALRSIGLDQFVGKSDE